MKDIIIVNSIPLTVAEKGVYDGVNKETQVDFCITQNGKSYTVDIFDAQILDNDDAHLNSLEASTLEEAVDLGYNYGRDQ